MTIVLQHQFDLATEHNFSVGCHFQGSAPPKNTVFMITHFTDPLSDLACNSVVLKMQKADDGSSDGTADTNTPTVVEAGSKPASDDNAAVHNRSGYHGH